MLVDFRAEEPTVLLPAQPKEMISVSRLPDGRTKVRINSSSLDVIQNCMRKAQLSLFEGWKAELESPALTFGSAIHAAMGVFYCGPVEDRIVPDLDLMERMVFKHLPKPEEMTLCLNAFAAFLHKAEPLLSLPDGDKRHPLNGAWILHNYFKKFKDDPYVCYVDKSGPFVERRIEFVLYEDNSLIIEYFGTVDMIARHTVSNQLMVFDHKTTSMIAGYGDSGSYFEKDRPNSQYCGYILAAKKAGINVDSLAVNIIEVKARPKTARGSPPSFPRQITSRDESDFEEFRDVVVDSVRRYLAATESGLWTIGPTGACNAFSGCTYKQVCGSPASLRNNILTAKFKRESK